MAQTPTDHRNAARHLAEEMYTTAIATCSLDDLQAAIGALDAKMDALPGTLNATQSLRTNLIQALPEPFKSRSTAAEKALALGLWALQEAGVL